MSIEDYYGHILTKSRRLGLDAARTKFYYIAGLKPEIQAYIMLGNPDTVDASHRTARLYLSTVGNGLSKSTTSSPQPVVSSLINMVDTPQPIPQVSFPQQVSVQTQQDLFAGSNTEAATIFTQCSTICG